MSARRLRIFRAARGFSRSQTRARALVLARILKG